MDIVEVGWMAQWQSTPPISEVAGSNPIKINFKKINKKSDFLNISSF